MVDQFDCKSCDGKKPADSWEQIGEPEFNAGGKGGSTTYTHYRCNLCESRWLKIRDSGGTGGHGTYYEREN